jgi:hypothetical protein
MAVEVNILAIPGNEHGRRREQNKNKQTNKQEREIKRRQANNCTYILARTLN